MSSFQQQNHKAYKEIKVWPSQGEKITSEKDLTSNVLDKDWTEGRCGKVREWYMNKIKIPIRDRKPRKQKKSGAKEFRNWNEKFTKWIQGKIQISRRISYLDGI